MKKRISAGIAAIVLCVTLVVTGLKTSAVPAGADDTDSGNTTVDTLEVNTADPKTDGTEQLGEASEILGSFIKSLEADTEKTDSTCKDETVYVIADAVGAVQKVIVSDWLKNENKDSVLEDKTSLKDIVNVKGDETFTQNGDICSWNAAGSDISYQGTSDKELPVQVKVRFLLDGKEMSPEEIKGKSGHVKIVFDYMINEKKEVEVGGQKEKMTVPFTMLTGVILDDEKFTDITASTAKLINDGSRTVIVGISFPGIQENLGLDRSKFEIPDHLEIEADVQDFSMGMTVTIATTELFGKLDGVDITSLDSISDSMEQLNSAMKQLVEGSGSLKEGLNLLLEKSGELGTGVGQLADGAEQLKNGIKTADDGTGKLVEGAGALSEGASGIKAGAEQLGAGLDQLAANNDTLMAGALQVFNTLLKTAENSLKEAGAEIGELTADNYAEILEGVKSQLTAAAEMLGTADPETAAVYSAKAQAVAELKASLDSYNMFYQGLGAYTAGVAQAATGADTLATGAAALNSGAADLKNGLDSLKEGTAQLYTGADALSMGLGTLNDNIPALIDGITQLSDGSGLLADGIKEFSDQGISKLTEAVEGELEGFIERIRMMGTIAREYNNFSGIADGMQGQVKFIYRTEEIK